MPQSGAVDKLERGELFSIYKVGIFANLFA